MKLSTQMLTIIICLVLSIGCTEKKRIDPKKATANPILDPNEPENKSVTKPEQKPNLTSPPIDQSNTKPRSNTPDTTLKNKHIVSVEILKSLKKYINQIKKRTFDDQKEIRDFPSNENEELVTRPLNDANMFVFKISSDFILTDNKKDKKPQIHTLFKELSPADHFDILLKKENKSPNKILTHSSTTLSRLQFNIIDDPNDKKRKTSILSFIKKDEKPLESYQILAKDSNAPNDKFILSPIAKNTYANSYSDQIKFLEKILYNRLGKYSIRRFEKLENATFYNFPITAYLFEYCFVDCKTKIKRKIISCLDKKDDLFIVPIAICTELASQMVTEKSNGYDKQDLMIEYDNNYEHYEAFKYNIDEKEYSLY